MPDKGNAAQQEVWIGLICVVPEADCDMLAPEKGAYTHVLTLASSEAEYRSKVIDAMTDYRLNVLEITGVEPLTMRLASYDISDDLAAIAEEITSPNHVRYGTFHTFPRVM